MEEPVYLWSSLTAFGMTDSGGLLRFLFIAGGRPSKKQRLFKSKSLSSRRRRVRDGRLWWFMEISVHCRRDALKKSKALRFKSLCHPSEGGFGMTESGGLWRSLFIAGGMHSKSQRLFDSKVFVIPTKEGTHCISISFVLLLGSVH